MIVVVNNSVADVKVIESEEKEYHDESMETKEESVIFIEEAFNKNERSGIEKKLYRTKILYTFIDIANRRIAKTLENNKDEIHDYIKNQLTKIINEGIYFSLFMIESLQ